MFLVTLEKGGTPVRITTAAELQNLLRRMVSSEQTAAAMSAPESNPTDIVVVEEAR